MFSYYGSKSKISKYYPKPEYDIVIEPFAGSARYALEYPEKLVWLNDSYEVVYNIWVYLLNATSEQISALPQISKGDDIRELDISPVEKDLMGFMINMGVPYPHHIYTTWAARNDEVSRCKKRILKYLPKIRHWGLTCLSYEQLPNIEATWYIDPPYQNGGERYIHHAIDYTHLAEWCKSRRGQVIVCENSSADWMDFRPLVEMQGQRKRTTEVIWTNS